MEIILFTLVAIILYLVSDSIVKSIEQRKGERLKYRSILFLAIISLLAVTTFSLLQTYGPELGLLPESTVENTSLPTE